MTTLRIGLLGGTFDPVHLGHLIMAERAAEELGLDRVLFVPAQTPPHKRGRVILSARHRVAMVQLAIAGNDRFAFSDLDLRSATPSYTSELLVRASSFFPNADLSFIIGSDSLRDFPTWHDPATILTYATLAVARRPGVIIGDAMFDAVSGMRSRTRVFDTPLIDISASDIRARVHRGSSIRYLVTDSVRSYIQEHELYR